MVLLFPDFGIMLRNDILAAGLKFASCGHWLASDAQVSSCVSPTILCRRRSPRFGSAIH